LEFFVDFLLVLLSYPSIAFVALVGFGREGFEHFVCPCHCIGLSSPWRFGGEMFIEIFTLGFLEP
jgi:hypothetical protein